MNTITRRHFIGTAALGAVAMPAILRGAADDRKLKVGLIGCGWYGMVDLDAMFRCGGVEAIALCDVDSDHLKKCVATVEKKQGSKPQTMARYEDLLALPELEAVIIATPPHWHALIFLAALKRGVAIYCEKPLAYDIGENLAMVKAAQGAKQVIQIGFQRRQSPAIRQAREYLKAGKAGRIVQVDAQIHYTAGIADTKPQNPPASLDWETWCGPAPKLPYCPQIGHMNWRLEKEYGHGHLVDWGIHLIDATRFILGESMPQWVQATGGLYELKGKITTPDTLTAHFEFAQCPVVWRHRIWGAAEYNPEVENGIFFYCDKETVFVTDDKWIVVPRDRKQEKTVHSAGDDTGKLHVQNFLQAVREGKPVDCTIGDACLSTSSVQLAMISYETGSKVQWDANANTIPNNPDAAKLLKREYRKPWQRPT
jgi:predicted dehydrogenase